MAYVIDNGAFALVTFQGLLYDQVVMNTFHYQYGGAPVADGATYLANFLTNLMPAGKVYDKYRLCVSNDVNNLVITGQWISPLRYRKVTVVPVNRSGDRGPGVTPNIAMVVSLTADEATRHGIGNKHLPGVAIDDIDTGVLVGGAVANLDALGTAASLIILTGGGGSMTPVIYNRTLPLDSLFATGHIVNPNVRTERRRTVGLGI